MTFFYSRKIFLGVFILVSVPLFGQNNTRIDIGKDSIDLGEAVVVGYGSQTRKQLTKSISSIGSGDIERLAPTAMTIQDILSSGLAKGVFSIQNTGEPGASPTINVRGVTSPYPNFTTGTSNNAPLYVIDGIPMFVEANSLNPLLCYSPTDIESIDILKDAAATAIYGSRGANGVIMIRTKVGKKNEKPQISFGYSYSIARPIKKYKVLNNSQFRTLYSEMINNSIDAYNKGYVWDYSQLEYFANISKLGDVNPYTGGESIKFQGLKSDAFGNENIDWQDEIERTNAGTHQYNVAIRGGSNSTIYSVSFHGSNKEGIYKNDNLNTYGGRLSLETDLTKGIKIGTNASYSESKRNFSLSDEFYWYTQPFVVRPDLPIKNSAGDYNKIDEIGMMGGNGLYSPNPVAMLNMKNSHESSQLLANAYAEFSIYKGLKFRADYGHTNYKYESSYFRPIITQQDQSILGESPISTLTLWNGIYKTSTANFQVDYKLDTGKHNINALLGYGTERTRNVLTTLTYEGFPNDEVLNNVASAKWSSGQNQILQKHGLNSWFTRLNYGYFNKYFAEFSFRADASSKFGPNNQWGYFPAFSAAWVASQENFFKRFRWLDNLKFRASIGQTGSTNIDDFSYRQYYSSKGQYIGNSSIVLNDMLPNKGIKWEKTTESNFGIDFAFLNNRIYGNIDVYYRKTDGALAPAPHIAESGQHYYFGNIIDLTNKGYEISFGADIVKNKDFIWKTILNLSSNRSVIDKLNDAQISPDLQESFIVGYPVGTIKGYVVDHIVQSQEEIDALNENAWKLYEQEYQSTTGVGDYLYKDINGNGIIDDNDRTIIVNPEPTFFGGWFNQFSYKSFTLSFTMQFSYGGEALYTQLQEDANSLLAHSVSPEMYGNFWTPERKEAKYARLAPGLYNMNSEVNDRYVFSTSYLRMKNITFSYNIPNKILQRFHANSANIFLTATNLFTICNWPGLDPETLTPGATYMGRNTDPYPLSKSISIGLNLHF